MDGITFLSGSFIRKHTVVVGTPRCLCLGDLGSEARPVHPVEPLSFPAQPCPPSHCAPVPRAPSLQGLREDHSASLSFSSLLQTAGRPS